MAEPVQIDISRPVGDYGAFELSVSLDSPPTETGAVNRQRFQLLFEPSAREGGWYLTIRTVVGVVLVRSVRLTPTVDLIDFARVQVDGLPPGRLRIEAVADPGLYSLTDGSVTMWYDLD